MEAIKVLGGPPGKLVKLIKGLVLDTYIGSGEF